MGDRSVIFYEFVKGYADYNEHSIERASTNRVCTHNEYTDTIKKMVSERLNCSKLISTETKNKKNTWSHFSKWGW